MTERMSALKSLEESPSWDWPEDTAEVLLRVLRDRSASEGERALAADLAGDSVVVNDELCGALLSLLGSAEEPEAVRCAAAVALGPVLELSDTYGFDEPDATPISERTFRQMQEAMHSLYLDQGIPKEVRRRVLEGSVRAPVDWHEKAIRTAFGTDDEDWKLTAVFCMQYVKGFDEEILESLESASPAIHVEAIHAAGEWGLEAAWPHVVGLIEDASTEKSMLLAAIVAVGCLRPEEAVEVLSRLEESDDPEIVEAVEEVTAIVAGAEDDDDDFEDDDFEDEDRSSLN